MTTFDGDGLFVAKPGAIQTWKRHRVDPLDLKPEDIDIEDIAHALARQCRYNGHTGGHLSVARHSIWVADHLEPQGEYLQLWGLLHDAAEAYLGDLVRPLKHSEFGVAYIEAEQRAERAITETFGLEYPMPSIVKAADNYVTTEIEMAGARWDYQGHAVEDEQQFLLRYVQLAYG